MSLLLAGLRDCCYTAPFSIGAPSPQHLDCWLGGRGMWECVSLTKPLADSIYDIPSSLGRIIALNSSLIKKCSIKKHLSNYKNYSYLAFQHPKGLNIQTNVLMFGLLKGLTLGRGQKWVFLSEFPVFPKFTKFSPYVSFLMHISCGILVLQKYCKFFNFGDHLGNWHLDVFPI